ncbi:hypothetical protein [Allosphingosinicella deserti]|nr:hypothetical protein [Sphingomonas deserti]
MVWLLIFQASASAPSLPPSDFDLAKLRAIDLTPSITGRCGSQPSGEIVVCGRRQDEDAGVKYRPEFAEQQPLAAEIGIGGGAKARAFVDQVGMPDGQISKRIMVGIKVPF